MEVINSFDENLNKMLETFVRKPTLIRGVIHLLLVLYAARIAPTLPKKALTLFENVYFKLFVFSIILWTAQFTPVTSILIALAFMVTVNYANNKPLWEFLENVDSSSPVAPSKEMAVEAVSAVIDNQLETSPMVESVSQSNQTIIVQPSIVQSADGPSVVNPSIVVAPAIVENSQGDKIVITPEVTLVEPKEQQVLDAPPASLVAAPAAATQEAPADGACYPIRKYDMSKVQPITFDDFQQWKA